MFGCNACSYTKSTASDYLVVVNMATLGLETRKLEGEFYHRRVDRSPEKETFYNLPQEDRALVSQLRQAVSGAKSKVTKLHDELDEKDRSIDHEASLRKVAEERLEKLVDMYGDPAVNAELHERLPRAAQSNNIPVWMEQNSQGNPMRETEGNPSQPTQSNNEDAGGTMEIERSPASATEPRPGFSHHLPYPPLPHPHYNLPPYLPTVYPIPHPVSIPIAYIPTASQPSTTATTSTITNPHAPDPLIPAVASTNPSTSITASPGDAGDRKTTVAELEVERGRYVSAGLEQQRQISALLSELDAVRQLNHKLQTELDEKSRELTSLRLTHDLSEQKNKAEFADQLASLVEEIYRAQQARDQAVLARLHTANQERDEALTRLNIRQNTIASSASDYPELGSESISDLMRSLEEADSVEDINREGRHLMGALSNARHRQWDTCNEEMKVVLEERDNALVKCGRLEREVDGLEREKRREDAQHRQTALLRGRLAAVEHERDAAIDKLHETDEEVQSLRIFYSLHKSLSQEEELRDQYTHSLETLEAQLKTRDTAMDRLQSDNERLRAQLESVTAQNSALVAQVKTAQVGQEEALTSKDKMERLVNVLRRKINGLGTKSDD